MWFVDEASNPPSEVNQYTHAAFMHALENEQVLACLVLGKDSATTFCL